MQQQRSTSGNLTYDQAALASAKTDAAKPNPRIRECIASIWQAQHSKENNVVGRLASRPSVIVYTSQKTALRLVTHLQHDHVVLVHHSVRPLKDSIAVHLDLLRELVRRITRQDLPAHHLCPPLKPRPPLFRHHVPRCPQSCFAGWLPVVPILVVELAQAFGVLYLGLYGRVNRGLRYLPQERQVEIEPEQRWEGVRCRNCFSMALQLADMRVARGYKKFCSYPNCLSSK